MRVIGEDVIFGITLLVGRTLNPLAKLRLRLPVRSLGVEAEK